MRSCSGILDVGKTDMKFYGPGRRIIRMDTFVPADESGASAEARLGTIAEMIGMQHGITVKLDPVPVDTDPISIQALNDLTRSLEGLEWRASVGSFRYLEGSAFDNLIFDLYLPREYDASRRHKLVSELEEDMSAENPRYHIVPSVVS